ncbi:hypothetical protein AB4089_04310 [Arthrobacter sp. 2MCAF15]|uniref:hypothetical protein n=1 Tax=Arthrobacter sp. 2MCAF15 TaxID=3232984 RepID=UPI003F8E0CB7
MTGTRDPQEDGSIQAMLSDSGLESAAELRSALEELRAVVPDEAPALRADLAALLTAGAAAPAAPDSAATTALPAVVSATTALPTVVSATTALPTVVSATDSDPEASEVRPAGVTNLAERRGRKRRLAIVGGAVIGAMSLGAGAVAASSEDFRHSVSQTVGVIFQPAGHATPAPEPVQQSPSSVPVLPAPGPTYRDVAPGAAPTETSTPSSPSQPGSAAAGHTPPAAPPAVGRGGILPAPGQKPSAPGLPTPPGLGGGNGGGNGGGGEKLPRVPGHVTPTLPGVLPTDAP